MRAESRHEHDFSRNRHDKARTALQYDVADENPEPRRSADEVGLSERILRLGDDDGKPALALRLYRLYLFQRFLRKIRAVRAVNLLRDVLDLLRDGRLQSRKANSSLREFRTPLRPLPRAPFLPRPPFRNTSVNTAFAPLLSTAAMTKSVSAFVSVAKRFIATTTGFFIYRADIFDMFQEIGHSLFERLQILA